MTTDGGQARGERIDRRRLLLNIAGTPVLFALSLFLPAGNWAWTRGWLFLAVFSAAATISILYIQRVNPELVAARVNPHKGTKGWDRAWLALFFPTVMAIMPVAALDDGRFHGSAVPPWVCALGYVLMVVGMAGLTWAQAVNRFFEPTVRIQADRGQTVIDNGPYAVVRHPGYLAWLPAAVGIALSLGSLWALIPAVLSWLLMIPRTYWEDRTLQAELPGYADYAHRVRSRLIPGFW